MTSGEIKSSPGQLRPCARLVLSIWTPPATCPPLISPVLVYLTRVLRPLFKTRAILFAKGEVCTPGLARHRASASNNP